MHVDAMLHVPIGQAGDRAAALEAEGYHGLWTAETAHDPFLPLALAAGRTSTAELGTSIAVGFARNPMTLANIGWDLQALSGGRFILGLGSQIRPHITKRFSMPWSHPAARMNELIRATRAIWQTWLTGEPLRFKGQFYTHTLMTPMFAPSASDLGDAGPPLIFLAGVGELMTETAGEVADGFICHAFTTATYLREVTIPALQRGRAKAGRDYSGLQVSAPLFVVFDGDDHGLAAVRQQLAFYGSTPAYLPVLDIHGWGDLHTELNRMSKRGQWVEMAELIDDEVLRTFAVVGTVDEVGDQLIERYGDLIDRVTITRPAHIDLATWSTLITRLQPTP
ncbi:MAG TPA: TIGR03617 family F420-dependent LLM class oxidoreductase [Ilumatobacteraceae bacterium]|nr:TIGR03617 family F420-dependent LLM class oxidoreductase [Ilumatobacteraceae bacterium]